MHIRSSSTLSEKSRRWPRLLLIAGPLVLLALEAALLTPLVEFSAGWMGVLASPQLFNAVFLGFILFILLSIHDLSASLRPQRWSRKIYWILANILAFYTLLRYTVVLERQFSPQTIEWYHAAGWLFFLGTTTVAAWFAFIPGGVLLQWFKEAWHKVVGSGLIAIAFTLLTPDIQSLWHYTYRPFIALTSQMLRFVGQEPWLQFHHNPVLGVLGYKNRLTVTQYCAEMESFGVFFLLASILTLAHWQRVRKLRMLVVVAGGIAFLYIFNAIRIALLIEIATFWAKPQLAVSLAHSRLASLGFLGLSLLLLMASKRWWCRPSSQPSRKTEY